MKKIFLSLFLLALTVFPDKAFSLTYDKKTTRAWVNNSETKSDTEGFFGISSSCPRLGEEKSYGLIQGTAIIYYDGGVRDFQKGIYECRIGKDSKIRFSITEGLVEFTKPYEIQVYYKTQNNIRYVYRKIEGKWYFATLSNIYSDPSDSRANYTQRVANNNEEKEAEKLYTFYKNLDLSSRSAKIYGDKILNNDILTTSSISKASSSSSLSKLPNCVGRYNEKTWTNCYGIYKWSTVNESYEGEFLNGKRHGFGSYFYANGSKYIGEWSNDRANGKGTMIFVSGAKYVGEVKNAKRHGQGTYFYVDGERLTGKWNENEFVDANNYRKIDNDNSNFYRKPQSAENTKLRTSSGVKEYWWVVILLIGIIFFVYTQTKKDLNINTERSFKPKIRETHNIITQFVEGKKSLGFSFWIAYALLTTINFFLFSILDDYAAKNNLNSLIPQIFAWVVIGCYIFSCIGSWKSATNYKLQKIRTKEPFVWATAAYVTIVVMSILLGLGVIQGFLEAI